MEIPSKPPPQRELTLQENWSLACLLACFLPSNPASKQFKKEKFLKMWPPKIIPMQTLQVINSGANSHRIFQKYFLKKELIFYHKFSVFQKLKKNSSNSFLIVKNHHNCLQYERVLKILYFRISNDHQIWTSILIILMITT